MLRYIRCFKQLKLWQKITYVNEIVTRVGYGGDRLIPFWVCCWLADLDQYCRGHGAMYLCNIRKSYKNLQTEATQAPK